MLETTFFKDLRIKTPRDSIVIEHMLSSTQRFWWQLLFYTKRNRHTPSRQFTSVWGMWWSHFVENQLRNLAFSVHTALSWKSFIALSMSFKVAALAILLIRDNTSSRLLSTPLVLLLVHSHQAFSRWKSQRTTSDSVALRDSTVSFQGLNFLVTFHCCHVRNFL